ncbi:hypothetical protein FNW02_34095 [Komarekiella sp. 'clone 1']|uniref:Uncharacterized protein n=1 Tax=Komarekiella delphini-convector SJRDD-AB1 TaxID=2593771 RepID=A0AA40T494_9NOST|nr:hypothetical protein [Komarekiella delphini-convector]MBD6620666.1 hypothetical protein [Komarekiella delphini-convector SJRDD-AB1]
MTALNQSDPIKLVLTCDLGASVNKALAQIYPDGVPQVITLSPEVADVEKESVKGLDIETSAQNAAWVGIRANASYLLIKTKKDLKMT